MIAWFIMLHHKPEQFEWLLNAIYNPDDIYLIHVDLKSLVNYKGRGGTYSRVQELISTKHNIHLLRPRFTNWGGWSLGRISLDAIDILLDRDPGWTHFINLSGECYPLRPMADIRALLQARPREVFVQTKAFSGLPAGDWHRQRPRMIETPVRIVPLPGRRQPPRTFQLNHKGSQWVMLPRAFCTWQRQARLRRDMDRYLRFSPLSDELVFQTLLLNGPFADQQSADYGRAIRLVEPAAHPVVLTSNDLDFITGSDALFGRKFDAAIDPLVLQTLAGRIGARPVPLR